MGILALEFTAGCSYIQVTDNTPQSGQEGNNDLNDFAEVMSQLHEEVRKQRGVTRIRKSERMPGRR